MKQQTYLHIADPCHEKWDEMTLVEKGKFCAACSKQVIDFTLMSDQQILNYFSKPNDSSTCGRFANDQLQRPLIPMHHDKKRSWWAAAVMPLMLFFNKTYSQGKAEVKQDTTVNCTNDHIIMGKIAPAVLQGEVTPFINPDANSKTIKLKGTVLDENREAIIGAYIRLAEKDIRTSSDEQGNFEFYVPYKRHVKGTLLISSAGYKIKEIPVLFDSRHINNQTGIIMQAVVLEPEENTDYLITAGVIFQVEKPESSIIDTVKRSIINLIEEREVTVYPNPVASGGIIHLRTKKESDYSVAVFSTEGKLLLTKEYRTLNKFYVADLVLPDILCPGIYYIQVTNKKTKKQSSEKIIVQ